jgi:hypothetical protein
MKTFIVFAMLFGSKSRREFISDRVNAMLHYMLIDDLLNPILFETHVKDIKVN